MAAEVEKYFETKINPVTVAMKASRMQGVTKVTPEQPTETTTETTKSNEIKRKPAKDGTMREGRRD